MNDYLLALLGGVFIGISTSLLLLFKGRVFGISGILGGILAGASGDKAWRVMIMLGLIAGGAVAGSIWPELVPEIQKRPLAYVAAGLLVGFGTQLGGGCTSGHGVCGISRFSTRSLVATGVFMMAGIITVFFVGG